MLSHSFNPNLQYAEYGLQFSHKRFLFGGINRQDIFDKNQDEMIKQLIILDVLRKEYDSPSSDVRTIIECKANLKGAFCGELAYWVREAILEKYPDACVEIVSFDAHELILIGRKRGNPKDITTWIDEKHEGVFLDPWANEIYLVSELPAKQTGPSIPFYAFGGPNGLTLKTTHYLAGNPSVLSSSNHFNDGENVEIEKKSEFILSRLSFLNISSKSELPTPLDSNCTHIQEGIQALRNKFENVNLPRLNLS